MCQALSGLSVGESVTSSVLCDSLQPLGLSMEFSRQEYWSGCHSLLWGICPTQGLNLGLLHCRQIPYHLSHQTHILFVVVVIGVIDLQLSWTSACATLKSQCSSAAVEDEKTIKICPKSHLPAGS